MEIAPNFRFSQLKGCVEAAHICHLSRGEATAIIDHQLDVINTDWPDAADAARLAETERKRLWHHQILNPYTLEGYVSGR